MGEEGRHHCFPVEKRVHNYHRNTRKKKRNNFKDNPEHYMRYQTNTRTIPHRGQTKNPRGSIPSIGLATVEGFDELNELDGLMSVRFEVGKDFTTGETVLFLLLEEGSRTAFQLEMD